MAKTVVRRDRGWNQIRLNVAALANRGVKVGLLAGSPSQDGVAVIDYATWNEYGTATIPARPFMRTTSDRVARPMRAKTGINAVNVRRITMGDLTPEQMLDRIGLWYQAQIRHTIRTARSWAAPNAPYTIARKGSTSPLIEHGVMIGAINYEKTRI